MQTMEENAEFNRRDLREHCLRVLSDISPVCAHCTLKQWRFMCRAVAAHAILLSPCSGLRRACTNNMARRSLATVLITCTVHIYICITWLLHVGTDARRTCGFRIICTC